MKYIILILLFVACSNTENNRQDEMFNHVDSVVKKFFTTDTLTDTLNLIDTLRDTINIPLIIPIEDSLLWYKEYKLNDYTIKQKLYNSTKYEGIPYWLVTIVSNDKTRKGKIEGVYCSKCKLMGTEAKYYQKAEKWIKEN